MENTGSLFLVLNFEGEALPKTIELITAGKSIRGRDGRKWKNANPQRVALNSMARLPRLVIDENHATDLSATKGGPSPAMGWMTNLRADSGGSIRADVEWTKRGSDAILNKEYSFISPVFLHDDSGEISIVLRAGLTNSPNLQLPALNSEGGNDKGKDKDTEADMKKEIREALGLPESADDEDILAAIKELKGKALNSAAVGVDLAAYAPRADLNAMETRAANAEKQIAELNAERLKKEAESVVDDAIKNRKIAPASRDEYLAICSTQDGVDKLKSIFEKSPAIIGEGSQAPEGTPPKTETAALNAEDQAVAKAMGYTAEEFAKIKGDGK